MPALESWRARVAGLYRGEADDPVTRVLALAVAAFGLRETDFAAVIDGMEMDAQAIVAPDLATLDLYCDRVAAAVGRLSVRAFGDASAAADRVAARARPGVAAHQHPARRARGRRGAAGCTCRASTWPTPMCQPLRRRRWRIRACPRSAPAWRGDARARFAEASAAMRECDRRAMRPARLMGATYAALLARLERRGWASARSCPRNCRAGKSSGSRCVTA